jgi:hypothetical protein
MSSLRDANRTERGCVRRRVHDRRYLVADQRRYHRIAGR